MLFTYLRICWNGVNMSSASNDKVGMPAITGNIDYSGAYDLLPPALKPFRGTIITYTSSIMAIFVGFPLDTVKTRMQTHKNFTSYFDCIKKSYRSEGIGGFFRGIWVPLLSSSVMKSFSVGVFIGVKPFIYKYLYSFSDDTKPENKFLRNVPVCFLSGAFAGGATACLACPFEFTKIYAQLYKLIQNKAIQDFPKNLQTANSEFSPSTLQITKQIYKYNGIRGLYSGFKYHCIRDSIGSGIYFSIYESMKYAMNKFINEDGTKSSPYSILLSGGLSGVIGWLVVFPVDTAKSLIQKDAVTNILRKQNGLEPLPNKCRRIQKLNKRLFRGLGMSVTRTFITNMVFFSLYESAMAHII